MSVKGTKTPDELNLYCNSQQNRLSCRDQPPSRSEEINDRSLLLRVYFENKPS